MDTLCIDIETYSPVDLSKSGIYPYAEHPDFEILLFAYAFDNEPVSCIDIAQGEELPDKVLSALTDPDVVKTAFNAAFERICIGNYFKLRLPVEQWECTMVKAGTAGLPMSLAMAGKILGLEQGKMEVGKALIRYFSLPCTPTARNIRTRNLPRHDPQKWDLFKQYCIRDVEVERQIRSRLTDIPVIPQERDLYILDQRINDRGVLIDRQMVTNSITMNETYITRLRNEVCDISGVDNPTSVAQLRDWLNKEIEENVEDLSKDTVKDLLKGNHSDDATRILELRQELSKTSTKKYTTMMNALCSDGRIRGLLQFYGANRTGRWAGRLVQVQNLPQNHLDDLDLARAIVIDGDLDLLEMLFGNVPDTLSQLIRTAFIAKPGHVFYVADFSAIEARVIAWLADETWRMEVFKSHGKIYEASASQMFGVPVEEIKKGSPLRQKGKVAELALGYQGGANALVAMGALRMGLPEDELPGLVNAWRKANKKITILWNTVESATFNAINGIRGTIDHGVSFFCKDSILFIQLPSGRCLAYQRPKIVKNRFDKEAPGYEGMDQTTKQWRTQETYGGKLVENIVQAIARDCLAVAMLRLEKAGFPIVMHVHDEVIIEATEDSGTLKNICEIMGTPIDWAPGLPLKADGYVTKYYKKD